MADIAAPTAVRLRQPSWLDVRLVVGVLLILTSVVVGARVVAAADSSVYVWAVRRALPAGTAITRGDLVARRVRLLDGTGPLYVDADVTFPDGRVLLREVGAGELLPAAAIGDDASREPRRVVAIPVERAHALGGEIERGMTVDVIATFTTPGGRSTTRAVLRAVTVVGVARSTSGFAVGRADFSVFVEVAPELVVALTAAIESARLNVVRVLPGALGRGDIGTAEVVLGPTPAASP